MKLLFENILSKYPPYSNSSLPHSKKTHTRFFPVPVFVLYYISANWLAENNCKTDKTDTHKINTNEPTGHIEQRAKPPHRQ